MALLRRLIRFLCIALVAFCVDISVLGAMTVWVGTPLWMGRLLSLPLAASTAWYLHRQFTFSDRRRRHKALQWGHYLLVNGASGLVNYALYVVLISVSLWMRHHFAIAVIPGAACAALLNFTAANLWVYRR